MQVDSSPEPVFDCREAVVVLDGVTALKAVDFILEPGEFVALLGDNGAGKTTLVKVLLGLERLKSGRLKIFGTDLDRFRGWKRIGYVPQRFGAASPVPATVNEVVLSGRASLAPFFPGYSKRDRQTARQALEAVNLLEFMDRPLASLSGGQQQRVLIARALSREPDVLVFDEPASGIDDESQTALADTLGNLNRRGHTVLMVAHGLGALASLVSRTVVLDGGSVVYDGPAVGAPAGHLHIHHHPQESSQARPVLHEGARPPR